MSPRGIPNKKKTEVINDLPDIDDLLEPDEPEEATVPEPEEAEDELDEEDAEIARLEAELKKPAVAPKPKNERPIPEHKLTPKQKKLRDLQDQVARKKTAELLDAESEYETASSEDTIIIHFIEDGFIAQGQMWYRGQEIEFDRNGLAYEQTKDMHGNSWVDLADDVDAQFDRWGKEFFRPGPWRGKKWEDAPIPPDITKPEDIAAYKQAILNAAAAERKRNRAAPVLNQF